MTAAQAEGGFACPITMTFAGVPALRAQPEIAAEWEPRLTATATTPSCEPATEKPSALMRHGDDREAGRLGRARQHDRRATRRTAAARAPSTSSTGHKWFCSAPMCDLFLVLAQTDEGVSCFAMPRILPDGAAQRASTCSA